MRNFGHFERLEHHLPDAGVQHIPLYLDEARDITDISRILLRSAEIIGGQLGRLSLSELVDQVGAVIASPDAKKGLIIEDEDGMGSVSVTPETTRISIRKVGEGEVSSTLFFDMLYTWASYNGPESQSPRVD